MVECDDEKTVLEGIWLERCILFQKLPQCVADYLGSIGIPRIA
nr:hypothetical protein [Candidatus Sigynarchaeota archaeon]